MDSLRGAAVVVTGASSGIGLAVAERFVAADARVLTGSRSEPPDGGGRWIRTDVADPVQADALVAAAAEAFGRVDVVVNNAGVQVEKTVAVEGLHEGGLPGRSGLDVGGVGAPDAAPVPQRGRGELGAVVDPRMLGCRRP